MKRVPVVVAFLAGCALVCLAHPARAQRRDPRLDRPTLSPYLEMFRLDPGPLGQYHSYVRPQLELQRALRQQATAIQRQESSIRTIGDQVTRMEQTGSVRPTGTASVFMNYSHYYSGTGAGGASGSGRYSGVQASRSSRRSSGYGY